MDLFRKICVYISSYIPLYFLILIKELVEIANGNLTFNVTNTTMLLVNLALIIIGLVGILYTYKKEQYQEVEIIGAKNLTCQNFLPYFPLFVLFALAFDLEFISMSVVYLLILAMVGIVYVRNDLFHVNPFLNIIGFSNYEIVIRSGGETKKIHIFSNKKIRPGKMFANSIFIKNAKKTKKN